MTAEARVREESATSSQEWAGLQDWLEGESRAIGAVQLALLLRRDERGEWQPEAVYPLSHDSVESSASLLTVADQAVEEDCPLADNAGRMAFPFSPDGSEAWCFCGQLDKVGDEYIDAAFSRLNLSVRQVVAWRLGQRLQTAEQGRDRLLLAHRLLAVVAEQQDYRHAAQALVNELAVVLDADRVTLGRVAGDRVLLVAISNSADFKQHQTQAEQIRLAMQEAHEQGRVLSSPPLDEAAAAALHHEQDRLAERVGGIQVLTLPLQVGGRTTEVVCIEQPPEQAPASQRVAFVQALATLAASILRDKARVARPLPSIVRERAGEQLHRLLGRGYLGRKLLALLLLGVIALLVLVPAPVEVVAEARLEGARQTALVAPFDGYLKEAPLRAGDAVLKGGEVGRLDDAELELERLRWSSRVAQLERQIQVARAKGDRGDLQERQAELAEARAELALTRSRLSRTRLEAPFDALIVQGDLSQRLGGAVKQGEQLFLLAPLNRYRVVLKVPESDVGLLAPTQQGTLVFDAFPDLELPVQVRRLTSESVIEDGQHLFLGEAGLEQQSQALRPGLEGVARVRVAEAPLWQVLVRRPWNWVRLWLWRWLP